MTSDIYSFSRKTGRWTGSASVYKVCSLYAISNDANALVKIGRTMHTPEERMRTMQGSSPAILNMEWQYVGRGWLESALHLYFKEHRRHGEFFDFSSYPDISVAMDEAITHIRDNDSVYSHIRPRYYRDSYKEGALWEH